jgi:hypothetical protein
MNDKTSVGTLDPAIAQVFDEVLLPFVDKKAVESLAFLLYGLTGKDMEQACQRLAEAILVEMGQIADDVGDVERAVVLTTLRAAVLKCSKTITGTA